jgi:hypothetical protein
MRIALWFACAAIALLLAGCGDLTAQHVFEVKCWGNSGFDADKLCLHPDRLGAELEIHANETTRAVQITIVKNDGDWWIKDLILSHCTVVDPDDWKCKDQNGFMLNRYAMAHGRYYHSLTGGDASTDAYTSSISGLTYWTLHYGFIDVPTALAKTGYPAAALNDFGKNGSGS